jgi:hypothetical protein
MWTINIIKSTNAIFVLIAGTVIVITNSNKSNNLISAWKGPHWELNHLQIHFKQDLINWVIGDCDCRNCRHQYFFRKCTMKAFLQIRLIRKRLMESWKHHYLKIDNCKSLNMWHIFINLYI